MILIKNGYVIDPRSKTEGKKDILIDNGKIVRMGAYDRWCDVKNMIRASEKNPVKVIDAQGMTVAPGLVDVHAHFREPGFTYKEDIESGARAAAAGGYTTVVLMANTKPVVDNEEVLSCVLEKGKKTGIHVESCACVTKGLKGKELVDMEALIKAGAVGFTDDGIPLLDRETVRKAMEQAAMLHTVISFHEEDPAYIENNGINRGKASAYFGIKGSDRKAEIHMIERDIRLAEHTGAVVNIQHISTREGVELVRLAKQRGVSVYAEATPHHFALTEEAVIRLGSLAKMNPPLREEADRQAIIEGLKDGAIDFIATDHAPHSREEKEKPVTEAPSGIIGLETALALGITVLVKTKKMTLMSLIEKMTWNPAALYRLDRGYLREGGGADLVIFDVNKAYEVRQFASRSCNSPFLGERLAGVVMATLCEGKVVYQR